MPSQRLQVCAVVRHIPATALIHGRMIISIFSEPDHSFPRLAHVVAEFRQQHSRSVALLDLTSAHLTGSAPASPDSKSSVPMVRTERSIEVALDNLIRCYKDIVLDTDDLFSPTGISALVAARTAVIAMSANFEPDVANRKKLIARIERGWLFNPRLKVIMLPVCLGAEPSLAHLDMVKSYVGTIPCIHMATGHIRNLHALQRSIDDSTSGELSALCHDIFAT